MNEGHIGERCKFPCPECVQKFPTLSDLANHFTSRHPSLDLKNYDIDKNPFKCPTCAEGFTNLARLRVHLRVHDGFGYKCEVDGCDKTFKTSFRRGYHMKHSHNISSTKKLKTPRKARKNNHLYAKDPKNCVQCPICKESYTDRKGMLTHIKTIHKEFDFVKMKAELDENAAYICKFCGKKYLKKEPYEDHIRNIHENIDEKVPCDVCGKTYKSRGKMLGHYYVVHGRNNRDGYVPTGNERKIIDWAPIYNLETGECKLCKKIIKPRYKKIHYIKFHDDNSVIPDIQCSQCDYKCKLKENLKQHIEFKHTEWKVFCQLCDRKFPNENQKTKHMKVSHKLITMLICDVCKLVTTKIGKIHSCPNGQLETVLVRDDDVKRE